MSKIYYFLCKYFREGHSHPPSYSYGDAHKCKKRCDCTACCCDSKKDILCEIIQIFLMLFIINLIIIALFLALNPFLGRRRKRRRRSLESLTNSLQVIQTSDKFNDALVTFYRVSLALVTNFLKDDSRVISEIGFNSTWSSNEVDQKSEAYVRGPRFFFGYDDNDPPKPDSCKKKCCKKCCKKDKILCIIQLILLIVIIILLFILIIILLIFPLTGRRKRRRRSLQSLNKQQCLPIHFSSKENMSDKYFHSNPNFMCKKVIDDDSEMKTIDEIAHGIRDALSTIVRTRDISVDLKHMPSMCQTCVQWSAFDLGSEYGPFLVNSAIPNMLQPVIL